MTRSIPETNPATTGRIAGIRQAFSHRVAAGISYRQAAWATGLALLSGLIQAAPYIGATPQPGLWNSGARALASQEAPYGNANLTDWVAGRAWVLGGEHGLAFWQGTQVFLVAAFLALFVLILVEWIGGSFPKYRRLFLLLAILSLLSWSSLAAWEGFKDRPALAASLGLSQPVELAAEVKSEKPGMVFATPSALAYLLLTQPGATAGLSMEKSAELSRKARQWREALRASGWRAVILAGPISEYRGLLDHLLISPDWRLVHISNQGFLFLRETGAPVGDLDPRTVNLGSARDTAVYLAQIAERYEAIRRTAEARNFSKLAVEAAPNDVEVLSHTAILESNRGKWYDAIVYCDRALKIDPDSAYLRLLKASCLLEINQPDKAEREARAVLDRSPNDLYTLFLYARISRALRNPKTESEILERLISLTPEKDIPVNYFVFLGQAYAQLRQPELAVKAYRRALARPDMGPELGAEIQGQVKNIEQKTGH